jgi:phosphate:Na+ symporter
MIFQITVTVVALVLIFIFSINKFSRQIEQVAGVRLKTLLKRLTKNPIIGTLTGTAVTSIIQSSTATTVMTVGLVNAGIITFYESLSIVFGANIGTTITSQLIAFNVTAIAPFIIIFGFLLLKFGKKYSIYGKSVFYFGLVFFCISLITQVVAPLTDNPDILNAISKITNIPIAIIVGILITTIFQSSSVTGGLILALSISGLISLPQGIGLMLGANIGTTSTALLATIPMQIEAKKTALAHFLFNVIGVIIIYPFLPMLTSLIIRFGGNVTQQIANMHLLFNLLSTVIFLIFIKQFFFVINWLSKLKILHTSVKNWEPKIGV